MEYSNDRRRDDCESIPTFDVVLGRTRRDLFNQLTLLYFKRQFTRDAMLAQRLAFLKNTLVAILTHNSENFRKCLNALANSISLKQ